MKILYRGWTITLDYWGYVATSDDKHDESGFWQVNGETLEDVECQIDEKECESENDMMDEIRRAFDETYRIVQQQQLTM